VHGSLDLLRIVVPSLHLFLVLLTEGLVCYLQASLALLKRVHPGKEDKGKEKEGGERKEGKRRRRRRREEVGGRRGGWERREGQEAKRGRRREEREGEWGRRG